MPIKKYKGSAADAIAYKGTVTYDCPICKKKMTTEDISLPRYSQQYGEGNPLINTPVRRLAIDAVTGELEIDYVCNGCKLPIKIVTPLEN